MCTHPASCPCRPGSSHLCPYPEKLLEQSPGSGGFRAGDLPLRHRFFRLAPPHPEQTRSILSRDPLDGPLSDSIHNISLLAHMHIEDLPRWGLHKRSTLLSAMEQKHKSNEESHSWKRNRSPRKLPPGWTLVAQNCWASPVTNS